MQPIIRVDNLGKQYRIGQRERYRTLRDSVAHAAAAPLRWLRGGTRKAEENTIWALRDVSFEVRPGEVVGIIGRNGAGKSTLLKILSRITEPTTGAVELHGRVGSLLEVGTGFHPELTGRENIYLNGAILGMKRAEIVRKFDEIVAFAEIDKFLDTPVKHYSSGMYMRLAFAVAAHLEPEILVVDEVLAVGDAQFQKKCLKKMEEVGQQGRTVLFVSHNMPAVTRLCKRSILLVDGRIIEDGAAHQVVNQYLQGGSGSMAEREWQDLLRAPGNAIVRLRSARVLNEHGTVTDHIDIRQPVTVEVNYDVLTEGHVLIPHCYFFNQEGVWAFTTADKDPQWRRTPKPAGRFVSRVCIPGNFFAEGRVLISVAIATLDPVSVHFHDSDTISFQVIDIMEDDSVRGGDYSGPFPGVVRPLLPWNTFQSTTIAR